MKREIAPGILLKHQNMFWFFVSPIPYGFLDIYPAPILTIFETDMNWYTGAYIHEKFSKYCISVLKAPKNCPRKWYFGWGAWYLQTAQTAQFLVIEVVSGGWLTSRGCAFCAWLFMRDVWFGCCDLPEDVHFIVRTTLCLLISRRRKILCKTGSCISRLSK